jgi:Domain of unknown function (DUF1839)
VLSLLGLDPQTYRPHGLHDPSRAFPETNCYADIVIELLHAGGNEPLAALARTVRTDFEGDQWTFFKPDPGDLEKLFGVDIHEMQLHRTLPEHIAEQLRNHRTIIVELDSFFLPDTHATAYRREHVKSSAVIEGIDEANQCLRYFHNGGLYELRGDDYLGVLRLDRADSDTTLPPYAEIVRFDVTSALRGAELRQCAESLLVEHFAHLPKTNPFQRFTSSLTAELPRLLAGDHAGYHSYAFATVRMAGSSFEVCASFLGWLYGDQAVDGCASLTRLVTGCKALSFKLARRRPFDVATAGAELEAEWANAMAAVAALVR